MCLICIELLKQKMTITEAERAANEMVRAAWIDDPKKFDYEDYRHKKKLQQALRDLDLDELDEVLDEGKEK